MVTASKCLSARISSAKKMMVLTLSFLLLTSIVYSQTTKGYEFWAAEMPNDPAVNSPFVIAVANTSSTPANVVVSQPNGAGGFNVVGTATVIPGALQQFSFASANPTITRVRGAGNIQPATTATYTLNVYRIQSDVKVVAYSFTPLLNIRTNDADLLLPTHALGKKHLAGSYTTHNIAAGFASQIGVVAVKPGTTNIKIYNRTGTLLDNVSLQQGQYFQRLNGNGIADDVTGFYVEGDQNIAVFTGNQITAVGTTVGASDHLSEQVLPIETLSNQYVAAPSNSRPIGCTTCAPDIFRYVATEPGTVLTTSINLSATKNTSGVIGAALAFTVGPSNPVTLNKGEFIEVSTNLPHVIIATKPFYGYQYLVSQAQTTAVTADRTGDPALLAMPVVAQFQYDYTFLSAPSFLYHFVNLVAPVGTNFYVDGHPVAVNWKTAGVIGGVTYQVANFQVSAGAHKIVGDKRIGIQVSSFETFASYAYLGGSGLEPINAGCITGGPYLKEICSNAPVSVQLSGLPSCDDGSTPTVTWSSPDPNVIFSNPNIANPVATVPGLGTYEVTMVVTCGNNIVACTSEINVREPIGGCASIPLSITPPPDKLVPTDAGQNYATGVNIGKATYIAPEPAVLTSDSLTQWPLGPTRVTWKVTDALGRTASGTHVITVAPPPTIVSPPMIVVPADAGQTYATVTKLHSADYWQSPSTYWVYNDFSSPTSTDVPANNQYSVGDNVISWSVVDQWGRTASGTQVIRVVPPPPSITPPPMITVPTDAGQGYATVSALHDASYWQSGSTYFVYNNFSVPVVSGAPAGNQYSLGDNTVTWSVIDEYGRTASGTQVVRVVPQPTIVPPALVLVPTDAGQNYATVSSLHGAAYWQSPSTYWVYNNFSTPSASGVPAANQYSLGDNTITWSVVDEYGRTASGTQIVRVVPPPTIVPPAMIVVPTDAGQNYATVGSLHGAAYWQSPSTYWVYNNYSTPSASGVPAGNQYSVGDNTITWSVKDEYGRTASGTQVVRVVASPIIVPPAMIVVPTDAGQNYATVTTLHSGTYWQYGQGSGNTYWVYNTTAVPTASGVASANKYVSTSATAATDYIITWKTGADQWGRSASGTQVVRVVPPPTIIAPPTITATVSSPTATANIASLATATYWSYGGTYWVYNNSSASTNNGIVNYPVGTTNVTWNTGTDMFGRKATGVQQVIVNYVSGEVLGAQGCTPGFWKNWPQAWGCGYTFSTKFFTVFTGVTNLQKLSANLTMVEAVDMNGGKYNALVRHATAALLSACHNGVAYPYTSAQIKAATVAMFNTGKATLGNKTYTDVEALKDEFARGNELGCPLGQNNAVPTARTSNPSLEVVQLTANVYPNPSAGFFTLQVSSKDKVTGVSVRIMDAFGRTMQVMNNVSLGKAITFGEKFASGAYYAEVTQGNERKMIQLVKAK